ncbi:trypsin-like peptidase domain-containing protein [Pelagicoccus sp. SDUM812003]|uniref:S1C family serine protease n=1 Tax=Pelagicoccus sp. SDUM812003 TaxID=3041267 RepID=UPI00280D28CE|nr:trypsin-like peptidase domain-containing protein [Pelagicoccus sp. SDUM812003]MDQ8201664.1 trypsin-like peptidase domain-containing protein [Pelagicoccus sp. SDUM812003]
MNPLARASFIAFLSTCVAVGIGFQAQGRARAIDEIESQLIDLYQKNRDAVARVKVATRTKDASGADSTALTVLSGFFIDPNGHVLTNALPSTDNSRIWIEKGGKQYLAVLVGTDTTCNLSLLQLAKPPETLTHIPLETTPDATPIGSLAIAITCPLEFEPTPKWGLVSGRESKFSDIRFPFAYTRVSIPSGPAEGGSPVFDKRGRLIGISVATLPEVSSSYIVPTAALKRVADYLRQGRAFPHLELGADLLESEISYSNEARKSVVVQNLHNNGLAKNSGLRKGDTILRINGEEISSLNQLSDLLFFSERDAFLQVTVLRGDEEIELAILAPGD